MTRFSKWQYGPATGSIYFPALVRKKRAELHIYRIMRRKRGWR